jgi:hypothetical protein
MQPVCISLDFKIGGQVIRTVKYADDLVLLAREEKVLQGMIDKRTEIGRRYGKEINVENTKVMRMWNISIIWVA